MKNALQILKEKGRTLWPGQNAGEDIQNPKPISVLGGRVRTKHPLQILIEKGRYTLWTPGASEVIETAEREPSEVALGKRLKRFQRKNRASGNNIVLFVAEDLLFYKSFQLPLKTPDLQEAISFQLSMLTPFSEEDLLYSFETRRQKDGYLVHLYAAKKEPLVDYLQDLIQAGFRGTGLFPEHQRYVNRESRRSRWSLVLPGRFTKVLVFAEGRLQERLLSNINPDFDRLSEASGTGTIYHPHGSDDRFLAAGQLTRGQLLLNEFDLLPDSYRQPDYLKAVIVFLAAINFLALFGWAGAGIYHLQAAESQLEAQISELSPRVKEINSLQDREQELQEYTKRFEELGANPDLITFMEQLTTELPANSYLAQMRMDPAGQTISMQGYTEDIGELTSSLQQLGETKLKSTSRRKNQTYFDVEVSLP